MPSAATATPSDPRARRLLALGAVLFLFGLLTGFLLPALASARIGLASHLEGVMNGTFLLVVGAIWDRVHLSGRWSAACFWLLVYGTYANWLTTLLAGAWGAGGMMAIAGGGMTAEGWQEAVVSFALISLSLAMVAGCGLLAWGLVRPVPAGSRV